MKPTSNPKSDTQAEARAETDRLIEHALARSERARETGNYVPSDQVVGELERRLTAARKQSG